MFAYLEGKLTCKKTVMVVIDCNGVGYEIKIPLSTFDKLPNNGEITKLLIQFSMSDDGIRLYGFHSQAEKDLFNYLTSVSGIGPKSGLAILSGLSVKNIIEAIIESDVKLLSTVPGIGKKTAERMIVELRDKVSNVSDGFEFSSQKEENSSLLEETESALLILGYKSTTISKAVKEVLKINNYFDSESLVKATIKYLYSKR